MSEHGQLGRVYKFDKKSQSDHHLQEFGSRASYIWSVTLVMTIDSMLPPENHRWGWASI